MRLITPSRVRLNVQMGGEGGIPSGGARAPTVCLEVLAHVVPDDAMTQAEFLGRDILADFPTRTYVDAGNNETAVTYTVSESGATESSQQYSDWVNCAVESVKSSKEGTVIAPFSGNRCGIPNAMSRG